MSFRCGSQCLRDAAVLLVSGVSMLPGVAGGRYSSQDALQEYLVPFILTVAILLTLVTLAGVLLCRTNRQLCTCCGMRCLCVSCDCEKVKVVDSLSKDQKMDMIRSDMLSSISTDRCSDKALIMNMEAGSNAGSRHDTSVTSQGGKCERCVVREGDSSTGRCFVNKGFDQL